MLSTYCMETKETAMAQEKLQKLRSLLSLLVAVVLMAGMLASATVPAAAATKTSRQAYREEWRKLWEDHITWTRIVILGILDNLPGNEAYVNRLLQNPGDMADALRPYYGPDADVMGDLVTQHLAIAAEALTDAKNGDTAGFNDAKTR